VNQNKGAMAFCKLTHYDLHCAISYIDNSQKPIKTVYHMFTAPTEERLVKHIKYYCEHYGILACETVDQEEYMQYAKQLDAKTKIIEQGKWYESNTQI